MQGLAPPKTLKVYQLLKMSTNKSLYILSVGTNTGTTAVGTGMYTTLQEAEYSRTLEILRDTDSAYNSYHIFELEFPNPIYKE